MIRNKQLYAVLFFILLGAKHSAQQIEKIKFKKDRSLIYFFQKGIKSDTVFTNRNNLFYLLVPDSLKNTISIHVENGQLMATSNDSLVKLNPMKGLKYESYYLFKETALLEESKPGSYEFRTLVNGTVFLSDSILVQFVNRKEDKVILENIFLFK